MAYRDLHLHPQFPNGIQALKPTAPSVAAKLEQLSITADSVVVTVLMTPRPENRAVQIHWNDETVDFVDFRKPALHTDPSVPSGTFKVQHVYRKSSVSGFYPNRVYVILAIYSDGGRTFDGTALDLEPRFRCTLYPTVVKATHHDTALEEVSEFDITMLIRHGNRDLVKNDWRWEPKTFDIDFPGTTVGIVAERMLEGSGTSTEMTLGGPSIIVWTNYVDDDGAWGFIKGIGDFLTDIPVEFDTSVDIGLKIDPKEIEGPFSLVRSYGSDTEYFEFHVSGSMDLLVPVDRGPVAVLG